MGCGASSLPAISEPSQEAANAGGRRKSYNTGGNLFPKSARNKERMTSLDEEDEVGPVGSHLINKYIHYCQLRISLFVTYVINFQVYQDENGHLAVSK